MLLVIGGEKGGTGKTTIATNLAAMRVLTGRDVLLVDTDRQSSASFWAETRQEQGALPPIASVQKFGSKIRGDLLDLAKRYQDVIVDAGGQDSPELRAALTVADRAFLPLQASQFDIWTLQKLDEVIRSAMAFNDALQVFVVLSRASTNPSVKELDEARTALSDFKELPLAASIIYERISYRKAPRTGSSILELNPRDEKAYIEIVDLYEEVFKDEWAQIKAAS